MAPIQPATFIEDLESTRTRLRNFALIGLMGWLIFAGIHTLRGRYGIVGVELIVSASCLVAWPFISRAKDHKILSYWGHFLMTFAFFGLTLVALFTGREESVAAWILSILPVFACYQLGMRAGLFWAIAAIVSISICFIFTFEGWTPMYDFELQPTERVVGQIVMTALLFGLTLATRRAADDNIIALRKTERELRSQAEQLQATAKDLRKTRDAALQAAEVKSQFLANMSHEIRTPLNGVIGMTNVLLETELTSEQRQMVKTVERSGASLLAIINEVLDFSKIEAGLVQLEVIPFDLHECVDDVLDIFSKEVEEKGLDLASNVHVNVPKWVNGDLVRTRQVLINLVGNAVKFTESGEVVVHTRLTNDFIQFDVADTGIGIAEENRDMLFRDFSQADASTTRRYGGTGLGLAISRRLVQFMGGEMWVESAVGRGSTFSFRIPLPEVPAPDRPQTQERISLSNTRLLIIGEPSASRKVLAGRARLWGMSVERVDNLSALIRKLADSDTENFDIFAVFDNDERDVILQTILDSTDDPLVVLVTSLAASVEIDVEHFDEYGVVVQKPLRFRKLRQIMEAMVGGWDAETSRSLSEFDPTLARRIPLKILVAEDNLVNQKVAASMLGRLGYDPVIANHGQEAIDIFEADHFDLIFMDIQMPVLDGLAATRKIRSDFSSEVQPRIIALSASVLDEQRREAFDAGVDGFVGKPYDVSILMHAIEQLDRNSTEFSFPDIERDTPVGERDEPTFSNLRALFAKAGKFEALIESHLENATELVEAIERGYQEQDFEAIKYAAHSLKSSSAMFGSRRVSKLAASLERLAGDEDKLDTEVNELRSAWDRAVEFFEDFLHTPSGEEE